PLLHSSPTRRSSDLALPLRSLAGRFAAKEALVKALGGSAELNWVDMAIENGPSGTPAFVTGGPLSALLERRGIAALHVSMSHDADRKSTRLNSSHVK